MLSTLSIQKVCTLLDPPDHHGKDWCLLAVQLGLTNKISSIEATPNSRTASLLHYYSYQNDTSVGKKTFEVLLFIQYFFVFKAYRISDVSLSTYMQVYELCFFINKFQAVNITRCGY